MDLCTICLGSNVYKNLSDITSRADGHLKNGLQILLYCVNIQPSSINPKTCFKCYRKMMSFYKFKLLALRNNSCYNTSQYKSLLPDSFDVYSVIKENVAAVVKSESDFEFLDEYVTNNVEEFKSEISQVDVKDEEDIEVEADFSSDNEVLSIYKDIKTQTYLIDDAKENKQITKKKRGRPKKVYINDEQTAKDVEVQICEECGKAVKNLKHHMKSHLPLAEKERIPCHLCDKTFMSYGARYRHHKVKHLGFKQRCEICNKEIVYLKAHMLMKHRTEELKHECLICKRRFFCTSNLEAHMRMHTNIRPYECADCGKTFRIKLSLTAHIGSVHVKEKSHLCQFCSKGFYKKNALKTHLRTHTKEKPYQCHICDKAFRTISQRKSHEVIHTGMKRYQCSLCDMSFYNQTARSTHMVSHTRERRHQCQYCGVKFGRSDHKRRHERTAHEKHVST